MKNAYVLALTLLAIPALADNNKGFYLGIGGSSVNDERDAPIDTTSIRTVELFGGYKYNDALGIELRLGSGAKEGDSKDRTLGREIGNYQSIYYKPELVNDDAKLYALLGYTKISSTMNLYIANPASFESSYSGFSYGVGIGFVINEHFNINFEYKNICEDLYDKPNTASVNFDYRF